MSVSCTNLAEKIAEISYKHFNGLPKTGKPQTFEWTVLSTIVQENLDKGNFEVVALGTGTKCIGIDKMSAQGDILNDSHAEIICRRAFLRYLLEEIKSSIKNESEIFTFNKNIGKCILSKKINYHFFSTLVPCGDAAIFSENTNEDFGDCLNSECIIRERKKRILETDSDVSVKRLKVEETDSLQRSNFTGAKCLSQSKILDHNLRCFNCHFLGAVRTKPGKGSPTLSVSCSDKIAKWCYLGIQGALVSLLLSEPIYLKTFIVAGGTPFDKRALSRAFYDRFPKDLQSSFNRIQIEQATLSFQFCRKEDKQPCPNSIIWSKTKFRPLEVAVNGKRQGITKKKGETKTSRLQICKMEIFRCFVHLFTENNMSPFCNDLNKMNYLDAKMLAEEYQKMWKQLQLNGFKTWTCKDSKLMKFILD